MLRGSVLAAATAPRKNFIESWRSAALVIGIGVVLLFALPSVLDDYTLLQFTVYIVMSILSVSLAFVWGFAGILCFGQAAFFGLGAYVYAIAVVNMGDSSVPLLLSIVLPALFAALLGYVIFYGRLSDVYVGVITLTVTLILFNLVNSTSGPEWRIGNAPLGGFNGIPSIPQLNWPGDLDNTITPRGMFNLSLGALIAVYGGLRWVIASRIGHVIVAIKENEQRALLLGYDARAYKLLAFTLGGAIAGLAGCLFANWGSFTSPTIFGLAQSTQIIIWVIVGGLGTLVGPVVGCVLIQWLTTSIGTQQTVNANLVLGMILVVFVLLVPRGLIPTLGDVLARVFRLGRARHPAEAAPAAAAEAGPEATPLSRMKQEDAL